MANDDCARLLEVTAGMERALANEDVEALSRAVDERQQCLDRLTGRRLSAHERETLADVQQADGRIARQAGALLAHYRKSLRRFDTEAGRMFQYESNGLNLSQGQILDNRR